MDELPTFPRPRLYPPAWFLMGLCLALGLHFLVPIVTVLSFPWTLTGLVAIALGVGLNLAADHAFKIHDTTVRPLERSRVLLTEGVFRLTRNPMYLGMVLILAGVAMLLGSLTPLLVCGLFASLLHLQFVLVEEQMLEQTFGAQWDAYRKQTRRWL